MLSRTYRTGILLLLLGCSTKLHLCRARLLGDGFETKPLLRVPEMVPQAFIGTGLEYVGLDINTTQKFLNNSRANAIRVSLEGEDSSSLPRSAYALCLFFLEGAKNWTVPDCMDEFLRVGCGEDRCGLKRPQGQERPPISLDSSFTNNMMVMDEKLCQRWQVYSYPACSSCPRGCFEGSSAWVPSTSHALYGVASVLRSLPLAKAPVICEIGFNAGHSALQFLTAFPTAHIISFDLGFYAYTPVGHIALKELFPNAKLELNLGNSALTVPAFAKDPLRSETKCNIIFIDGGHTYEDAKRDIMNMEELASSDWHVVLIDDVPHIPAVVAAWSWAVNEGILAKGSAHPSAYLFQHIPGLVLEPEDLDTIGNTTTAFESVLDAEAVEKEGIHRIRITRNRKFATVTFGHYRSKLMSRT